ncbi:MAG: LCP family protein [Candidatus Shapirobacteria bacterium]|nr:LCP family protein [Candidatus Shapirobacteria bacterium]MDD4410634.1 LCP family protein [Candidatus Shapirobacteria bacterium]
MAKKILIVFIIFNLSVAVFFAIFAFIKYRQVVVKVNKNPISKEITPTVTPTPDPNKPFAIALMGYGGGVHEGGTLTDSILVAQFIPLEKKIKLISIPRDLWIPIPVAIGITKMSKINAAYTIGLDDKRYPNKEIQFTGLAGGGQMSKTVLSQVLGFSIDNFATINFNGFLKTVDTLGGIDVNVQKTFNDPLYPIEENINDPCGKTDEEIAALTATMSASKLEEQFTCRYENLHFDKGLQHLDSLTALKFVRSRHSPEDGGDFNRSARQKLVIEALKKKIISLNFISKLIPFVNSLAGNLTTDINLEQMQQLISKADEYQSYKIESYPITDNNLLIDTKSFDGQFILIPKIGENNWTDIKNFVSQPTATSSSNLN